MQEASVEQLAEVEGSSQIVAEEMYHYLQSQQDLQARLKQIKPEERKN